MSNSVAIIHKLDNEEKITQITQLTTIIGRGKLLEVSDKRVSRNHALLNFNDGLLMLKSTHTNPCFLNLKNRNKKILLKQGGSITLENGDEFSLLQDKYHFEVQIKRHEQEDRKATVNSEKDSLVPASSGIACGINPSAASVNEANNSKALPENNCSVSKKLVKVFPQKKSNNVSAGYTSSMNSDLTTNTRKLPKWMMALPSKSEQKNPTKVPSSPPKSKAKSISVIVVTNDDKRLVESKIFPVSSETTAVAGKIDSVSKCETIISHTFDSSTTKTIEESSTDKESLTHLQSSSGSHVDTSAKDTNSTASIDNEYQLNANADKSSAQSGTFDHDAVAIATASKGASSTTATNLVTTREPCVYGKSCYRKNPDHFKEYSHPGDADYLYESSSEEEEGDNRPECEFGLQCYRKNPSHRRKFKHIRRIAPKRTAAKQKQDTNNEDSNEYDLDDSFIDDNNEEEDLSDDSDWAPSGNKKTKTKSDSDGTTDDDDVSDLVSSAKNFVKNKKLWKK